MGQQTKIPEISRAKFWSNLSQKAEQQRVPVQAMIELTYGCNLRCVHCYNPTHKARNELATEQVYRIIDQLAEQGCLYLGFTGGELFTRRDCFEIFSYAQERGCLIAILTNATLITPQKADQIRALKPHRVEISMYGATAETYERVTRIRGSYQRFVAGVRLLQERQLPLLIKMPLMTLNRHEVQQAKELVEEWGIRFVYSTEIHPRADGSLEPLDYRLAPAEVVRVNEELAGYRQWSAEGGGEKEEGCGSRGGLFTCTCGKSSVAVTPYGQMNLCLAFPTPEYDLLTGSVAQGWGQLVELVAEANAHPGPDYQCPSCSVQDHCQQGPVDAYLETGHLSPCLPYFKELAESEKQARRVSDQGRGERSGLDGGVPTARSSALGRSGDDVGGRSGR